MTTVDRATERGGPAMPALRMRRLLLALVVLIGCNVVRLRERALHRHASAAGLREADVTVGDTRVHVWHREGAAPLLLLHGFGASALWQWDEQLRELGRTHALVVPDLLGFGASSGPGRDASLEAQARAMIDVLDALGHARVDVVGVSYGGLVAYTLAGSYPERVGRLVLVDSPGHAWTTELHRALLQRFAITRAADLFVPDTPSEIRQLLAIAKEHPPRVPDWAARQVIAALYDPHRRDQQALLDALERDVDALAAAIARPRAPTLVVWGADDPIFPLPVGRRLAHELDAELVVLERARHLPNADYPRRFDEIVLAFLDRDRAIAAPVRVGRSARKRRRLMPSRKKSGLPYSTASTGMIASAKADSGSSHSNAAAHTVPSTRVMLATKSASGQRRWNPDHSHMRQRRSLGGRCRSQRRASQRGHNPTISPAQ